MKRNTLAVILVFATVGCNLKNNKIAEIIPSEFTEKFYWEPAEISGRKIEKAAMFIPLNIEENKQVYYAQFDLGSDATILYEKSIRSIEAYDSLKLDTLMYEKNQDGKKLFIIKNIHVSIGKIDLGKRSVAGFFNYGAPIVKKKIAGVEDSSIGTVGADVVQNKVLIIDFPKQTISILDSVNDKIENAFAFSKCKIVNNRVVLSVIINGKTYDFMYDTGASLFPMMTKKSIWNETTNQKTIDSLAVTNFGNSVTMFGAYSLTGININGTRISSFKTFYAQNNKFDNLFNQLNCDGLIGNAFFSDKAICIDYKTSRFGILH